MLSAAQFYIKCPTQSQWHRCIFLSVLRNHNLEIFNNEIFLARIKLLLLLGDVTDVSRHRLQQADTAETARLLPQHYPFVCPPFPSPFFHSDVAVVRPRPPALLLILICAIAHDAENETLFPNTHAHAPSLERGLTTKRGGLTLEFFSLAGLVT